MHLHSSRRFPLTARTSSFAGLGSGLAFVLLVLCATVFGATISGATVAGTTDSAPTSAKANQYSETTDIVVVEVPITVTRDGKPVRGLTADNFQIKFDGKVQEIRSLEMIDLDPSMADAMEDPVHPPIPGRRHFLLLFDLANSAPMAIVRARKAAREVAQTMHDSDLVAVGLYDHIRGLEFLLGFTTDREQVDIAIESFGLPGLFHPVNDPLQLSLGETRASAVDTSPMLGGGSGRAADLSLQADHQIREMAYTLDRFQGTELVERMAENFESMAQSLAAIQGQVHIVYLSEGFDSRLLLGNGLDSAQTRDDIERGEIWNVSSQARYGSTRLQNTFESMIESLRRSGAIVHSVDVGGLRAEESVFHRDNADVLNAMAQDTGGELYDNFNDLGDAMELMLEATSVTYLATLQPQGLPMDGEYRKLKVRLKDGSGRGTKVSHRAGFYAPRPFELADDVTKQLTSAQLILGDRETGTIGLDALAEVVPVEGERPYVTLFLKLDGKNLMASSADKPQRRLQLFAYAFDDEGHVHDFFTEILDLDLDKLGSELRRNGWKHLSHLDLDPGHYRVRVLVRDLDSGEHGVRTADVTVEPGASTLPPVTAESPENQDPGHGVYNPVLAAPGAAESRIGAGLQ